MKQKRVPENRQGTHIEDVNITANEIFHHLDLMSPLAICLEEAGCKEESQVLGAHLVQVSTFLDAATGD